MRDRIIEVMARGVFENFRVEEVGPAVVSWDAHGCHVPAHDAYLDAARAALTALQAEGMAVVPVVSEEPGRRLEIAVEAAAQWLISDDSAYEQSPEDAHRVAREMLRVANEAYQGIRMVTMETKGEA